MALTLNLGDIVCMKKKHPCGGNQWQVGRVGADIGLTCQTCGRHILAARSYLERRVKQVIPRDVPLEEAQGLNQDAGQDAG